MKYRVELLATAYVKQTHEVEADTDAEAAAKAIVAACDGVWRYDGLKKDEEIDVTVVCPVAPANMEVRLTIGPA